MKKLREILIITGNSPLRVLILTGVGIAGGGASFAFMFMVNKVIQMTIANQLPSNPLKLPLYFSGIILLYFISRRILSVNIIKLSQNVFWKVRKKIIRIFLQAPYRKLMAEKNEIYGVLTTDVGNLTSASLFAIDLIIAVILVIASIVYMIVLSPLLSVISMAIIGVGVLIYRVTSDKLSKTFLTTRQLEVSFLKHFNALLGGAKEISLEGRKGNDLYNNQLIPVADESHARNNKAFIGYLNNEMTGQVLFYLLITFIVLYAGRLFDIPGGVIISFVLVLLYILGPIESIMNMLPALSKAVISAGRIIDLQQKLESGLDQEKDRMESFNSSFGRLEINSLEYAYSEGPESFRIGPISLELAKGDITFIYGGNGSGKTTFLYTLLQLYKHSGGNLVVNGIPVSSEKIQAYQRLFAPVFSDFYLFDSFYGIENLDHQKLLKYLVLFELDKKVTCLGKSYSSTDLSAGQRKRLALISALLEGKPIIVLDEWAADQDPEFRRKFYMEILPLLKSEGFTILAITHDDAYYQCANRLFKMDAGTIKEQINQPLQMTSLTYE
jgi:putative ATP-binding cassette transporter